MGDPAFVMYLVQSGRAGCPCDWASADCVEVVLPFVADCETCERKSLIEPRTLQARRHLYKHPSTWVV